MTTDNQHNLTHTDDSGKATMVDVGEKADTVRTATAVGRVFVSLEVFEKIQTNHIEKGDVLTIAKFAGITGAKKTSDMIPLCHNISISKIDVTLELNERDCAVDITAFVKTVGKTGVEMEALTAVAIAALTVYDMCKAVDKGIVITDIQLLEKTGGKSGTYRRD
jgi:molybdenum cofactor biosynthesis protein MoaC